LQPDDQFNWSGTRRTLTQQRVNLQRGQHECQTVWLCKLFNTILLSLDRCGFCHI